MQGNRAFVISPQKDDISKKRHCKLNHFLDLVDACGFDLQVGSFCPKSDYIASFDVIFVDCKSINKSSIQQVPVLKYKNLIKIIFFNSTNNLDFEIAAIKQGVTGIFYADDKLENVIKGINTIKQDRKWFRRNALELLINEMLNDANFSNEIVDRSQTGFWQQSLTKREQTIVKYISQGAQNQEIADQLHISVNTVKTHIYSIFRKTNCRNRVELITWSRQTTETAC
ncbi:MULTISPECIES: helix-turn-helix transcriptional regulator [Alteromonadaceae]|uniref:helix-turn-helix transcriptional regulator n=1 Tax=Alteromonadaceae TaxID=72275 RepID=UPI001C080B71|nr:MULTISPECIES: response regulator transcription factor [Aliiglaciecola]MBU2877113.1 response regulator transcription factor [Aliiglaciecola lipolytica]MDO6710168.1 response regulator transcription factor [Aliiglaciecola sp. 2_MG-2023]MDO6751316.1 response regulator transcription factor [Aliiglaciecola sp. 1_MG-2023]